MSKMIEELTQEQIDAMPGWRDQWIEKGLSTAPTDVDRCRNAIEKAYRLIDKSMPEMLHFQSPYSMTTGSVLYLYYAELLKSKRDLQEALELIQTDKYSVLKENDQPEVQQKIIEQVSGMFRANAKNISDEDWEKLKIFVWNESSEYFKDAQQNEWLGSAYVSYAAFILYFRDVVGWDDPILDNFTVYEDLVESCGWCWWHEDVVAISDRPKYIKMDDENRLHSEAGPAIEYPDGYSVYAWHGTVIPRNWLEGELTAEIALTHENIEQRRAACEILGWDNILNNLNAKVIDQDEDPQVGSLLEVDIPDIGREKFLRVLCGTGRQFALPVPPEMTTALQANAWTFGIDEGDLLMKEHRT